MSSSPPGSDIVLARTPPLPVTRCHLATVALEMMSRSRTAVNSPIVPWTAGGGRGLHRGRALSPVGRGSSCQSGNVITPPLNMAAGSVTDRALRAAPVLRTPVLLTGSGPAGPAGVSVPLPVSHKATLPSGLAAAPVLTPALPPVRPADIVKVSTGRQRPATTCLTAQWTESGGLGLPSLPVLLPVGWGFRSRSGFVTAPPPNMAAGRVLEKDVRPTSVRPTSTVQWMGCGHNGHHGNPVRTRSGTRASTVS